MQRGAGPLPPTLHHDHDGYVREDEGEAEEEKPVPIHAFVN